MSKAITWTELEEICQTLPWSELEAMAVSYEDLVLLKGKGRLPEKGNAQKG